MIKNRQPMGKVQEKSSRLSSAEGGIQEKPPEEEMVEIAFTCEICIEPTSSNKKFKNNEKCVHPVCLDCLCKYIQAKVEENTANVKCPGVNCEQLLDPLTCQPIISADLFIKWCDCLCESSVLEFERCYCPQQRCSALVINECGGTIKRSKCPQCKNLFCFKCKVPWHPGYWCSEAQQRRDVNDVKFGELVERLRWTRCPHCGQAVDRTDGCRDVKCRCGNRFCHICGGNIHLGVCGKPISWRSVVCGCCSCCFFCLLPLFLVTLAIYFLAVHFPFARRR